LKLDENRHEFSGGESRNEERLKRSNQ